jgi:hypothetical protein
MLRWKRVPTTARPSPYLRRLSLPDDSVMEKSRRCPARARWCPPEGRLRMRCRTIRGALESNMRWFRKNLERTCWRTRRSVEGVHPFRSIGATHLAHPRFCNRVIDVGAAISPAAPSAVPPSRESPHRSIPALSTLPRRSLRQQDRLRRRAASPPQPVARVDSTLPEACTCAPSWRRRPRRRSSVEAWWSFHDRTSPDPVG